MGYASANAKPCENEFGMPSGPADFLIWAVEGKKSFLRLSYVAGNREWKIESD